MDLAVDGAARVLPPSHTVESTAWRAVILQIGDRHARIRLPVNCLQTVRLQL